MLSNRLMVAANSPSLNANILFQCRANSLPLTDDSIFPKTITNTAVTIDTTNQLFGAGCAYFNGGSTTRLTIPHATNIADLFVSSGTFTFRKLVRVTVNAQSILFSTRTGDTAGTINFS